MTRDGGACRGSRLVRLTGFEPTARSVGGCCSIQMSYRRINSEIFHLTVRLSKKPQSVILIDSVQRQAAASPERAALVPSAKTARTRRCTDFLTSNSEIFHLTVLLYHIIVQISSIFSTVASFTLQQKIFIAF